ncbi:MAG: glycosyl transferase [Rhodospirillales bacterium]|nr:glycosyl transferase [Rhodospirillales bacterium]
MRDWLIATGADAAYFPMASELWDSVRAAGIEARFGVIDAGLTDPQRAWFAERDAIVIRPAPIAPKAERGRPALAVNLNKLWLDRLFPDARGLIWLDADTWVQEREAVDLLAGAAATGALAIVPGAGRVWKRQIDVRWLLGGFGGLGQVRSFNFKNAWHARLPLGVCRDLGTRALLNAGAFALAADAPHWARLREWQARILRHGKPFTSDQLAIALAVYRDGLPAEFLPTGCNYVSPWRVDPARPALLETYYPYKPVGIVHLAAQKTMRFDTAVTAPLTDLQGRVWHASLRFGWFQRGMGGAGAAAGSVAG